MLASLSHLTASFVVLGLIFWPLERAFPAKIGQRIFRPEWLTDLCYFLGQYLVWGTAVLWFLTTVEWYVNLIVPENFRELVASQPYWIQAFEVILLGDFLIYWMHRLQHRVEILWRFHSVHHSAEHLDWVAAHREHPVDGLVTQLIVNAPAFILGFPISTLAWLVVFRGLWALFIHSNVRLPLGPLRLVVGSPELHHWHHARVGSDCNYANLSPLMDLLFGTYRYPNEEPASLGLTGEYPRGYLKQLCYPFRRRKR